MPKLVYWEIPSEDVEADAAFFAALFGWTMEPSSEGYMMFHVEDGIGGGIQKSEGPPGDGITVYMGVDDIPRTLDQAEELGAEPLHTRTDIGGDWGFWADFRAPGGARIGIYART